MDDAEAAARAACLRDALTHRTRLRGLTGDLEFLRYVDLLSDQERGWLADSSDRLDPAGGGLSETEHRLELRFAGLDNSRRRTRWLKLRKDDRATLLRHCPTMRRWVAHDLVQLNDFIYAVRSAGSVHPTDQHVELLVQLESQGWTNELAEPRDRLMARLGRDADERDDGEAV